MSLRSQRETTPLRDSASESEGGDSCIHSGMESNEDEDVDMHAEEYVGEILKDFAMANRSLKGDADGDEDDNDDQMTADIAEQSSIVFAPNLTDFFSHPSRTFPTLEAGRASLREKAHSEGFAIKKKYEKNADKQEGERSQRTRKEFQKRLHLQCVCAGQTTRDASVKPKRETRSRLKGCQWGAHIMKVDGSYRVKISGEHNHAAARDMSVYPAARRGTPEQITFVRNLIEARIGTPMILENMKEIFGGSCLLTAKDIQNRRQKYRARQKTRSREMDDQTVAEIAGQSSIACAPNLTDFFSHPSRTFPTLEAGRASLREKAHSEGFAIKKKYEKNADKQEGERSQRTRKEFQKRLYIQCVCAGQTTRDASVKPKRETRSRLKGCQWGAHIMKVDGSYRVKISGEHNHAAARDMSVYPAARRGTPEQETFVRNLIEARIGSGTILDNLREIFGGSCLLTAKDIRNRRQKYRAQRKARSPETDALVLKMIEDT